GVNGALGVEPVRLVRADGQVGNEHVGADVAEGLYHVNRLVVRLGDDIAVVLTKAVERRPALDRHAGRRHVTDGDRVVLAGDNRLGEIPANFLGVHVERGDELDVPNVVGPELDVHEARHPAGRVGLLVVLHALDEGTCAVPDAHDGYPYRTH